MKNVTAGRVPQVAPCSQPRESWSMSPRDFAVELALMFGRYVQVRYLRDRRDPYDAAKFSASVSMHCYDRDDRMHFTVEAKVTPDGDVRLHGGNWILNQSSAIEAADFFAEKAPHAYDKVAL